MSKKIVTGEVRLSYVHLFEPKAITEGGDLKYSVTILIPKTDKAQVKAIQDAVNSIIESEQGKLKTKKNLKLPLRDGDEESDSPEYEGHWFMGINSKDKPIVVDEDRQDVLDARGVYSGCFGRVSMNLYAFNTAGNKGIAAGLNAVQKTAEGEALGGTYTRASIEEDFDDLL